METYFKIIFTSKTQYYSIFLTRRGKNLKVFFKCQVQR